MRLAPAQARDIRGRGDPRAQAPCHQRTVVLWFATNLPALILVLSFM
jgi:hypothetical protein